ncbi:MAG: AAA family ATPase, partial [Oxalobacteraceae bacterium]
MKIGNSASQPRGKPQRDWKRLFIGSLLIGRASAQVGGGGWVSNSSTLQLKDTCGPSVRPYFSTLAEWAPSCGSCVQQVVLPPKHRDLRVARLDSLLLDTERHRSQNWRAVAVDSLYGLGRHCVAGGLTAWLNTAAARWCGGGASSAAVLGATLGQAVYQGVHEVLGNVFQALQHDQHDDRRPLRGVWRRVQQESQNDTASLPYPAQERLAILDAQIEASLTTKACEGTRLLLRRRQGILVSLPQTIHDLSHQHMGGDPRLCGCITERVRQLIDEYPSSVRPSLEALVAQMRANVFVKRPRRVQAYLQGAPGTGKTHFVRRLAEVTGAPLYEFSLNSESMRQELLGPEHSSGFYDSEKSDEQVVGQLAFGLLDTGVFNPILFIDEAGELLTGHGNPTQIYDFARRASLAALKTVLTPDMDTLSLRGLGGLKLDFSRATLILAGNPKLDDPALITRLQQISFAPLEATQKRLIAMETLAAALQNNDRLPRPHIVATQTLVRGVLDE